MVLSDIGLSFILNYFFADKLFKCFKKEKEKGWIISDNTLLYSKLYSKVLFLD